MQLLIVDDEYLLVESLKSDIQWDNIGFSAVFTAYNIRQAKEIFESRRIDIMICDIEMPQGSGLELLSWVKENYPKTESVFLTCHADFKFAQQAIQLGSFDYLLKPVPPAELEKIINKAMDKINKDNELAQYSRIGQFWFQQQPLLVERFWLDLLHQKIPSNSAAIQKAASERNIPYSEQMKFIPVLVCVQRWNKDMNLREEKIMEYALMNSAEEIILENRDNGQVISLEKGKLLVILASDIEADSAHDHLKEKCGSYITSCNQYFYCDLSCYIGRQGLGHELLGIFNQLSVHERNNVAYNNKVFLFKEQTCLPVSLNMPDMNVWSVMLQQGLEEKIVSEAAGYLERAVFSGGLNANMLHQFQQNFLQMVYVVLKQKGLQAHQLFNDNISISLSEQASRSVANMMTWIKHMIARALQYINALEQTESVVEKVKKHISIHIRDQELSREDIANYVFLNPDYLDRIFKKEMGTSVTEYVGLQRLAIAQELLSNTNLSISAVACQVGYTNLSHFSRRFKKQTNMNPNEYRMKHSKN
ncbi:response regulator [Paenibacillus alkaliterrae]|uniref:response regulator n=1 Tax=Paenibacillus alkaliterrae TaxID=320909 RepID=UPI001F21DBCD|nr:response regulator [Paenibacillus alkaliterrae]MCF2939521.1 response regulator [Paenibacillus alkaliterrae]